MRWWYIAMVGVLAFMYYVLIRVVLAHGWAEYHERGEQTKSMQSSLPDESHLRPLVPAQTEAKSTIGVLETGRLPLLEDSPSKQVTYECPYPLIEDDL